MFEKFQTEVESLLDGSQKKLLEIPKDNQGDLALPCFSLAKEQKRNPYEIAKEMEAALSKKLPPLVKEVKAIGPYVNFYINHEKFSRLVLNTIIKQKNKYGSGKKKTERIMIESPGPNTNKPLHLGHVRNMVLGTSMANIFEFLGYKVIKVDIINDRGIHICKSMLAYKKFGEGKKPREKPDHFVGDFYVLFAKKLEGDTETEEKLRNMLIDWEAGNKNVRKLWKTMNNWATTGFKETYKRLGVRIDKAYYESDHYLDGKKIVMKGLKANIFKKDEDGNIVIDLGDCNLGKYVVLRADGTSIYITQDLALAVKRYKEYKMNKMIYVVGDEQKYHFRALFKLLEILGYPFAKKCYHLAYGMVNLPEGKMKSREGTVVDADDIMDEMHKISEEKIKQHGSIPDEEIKKRAEKIGLAALKYFILKFDPSKSMTYDPKASIDFEGDTGPYLQYTYARANSILKKSKKVQRIGKLTDVKEMDLIKKLSQFSGIIEKSADEYKPNLLANYLFEVATLFNEFYHSVHVIGAEDESQKLALVKSVMQVLENGLRLLGIDVLKEM
ncbi:MAG: arginine--tRNA ligase [Candidatus Aenigmatarchaeota archaeon]